ncbi:MAG: hypothetical protein FWC64_12485 [Treponema sp.]|nr:hypothetical protein [Treponema sp.]
MANTENLPETPAYPARAEDNAQRNVVFRYSREGRLSRASAEVQALNDGNFSRPGLLKTLFSNKANRLLLFAIVFIFAASGLATRFVGEERPRQYQGTRLGGNLLALTIFPVEGTLFLAIIKNTPERGEFHTGAVDIVVSPVMPRAAEGEEPGTPELFSHRVFFNLVESEMFQISLPFEGTDFFVVLRTYEEQVALRLQASEG